jgi:hypothetical protein
MRSKCCVTLSSNKTHQLRWVDEDISKLWEAAVSYNDGTLQKKTVILVGLVSPHDA